MTSDSRPLLNDEISEVRRTLWETKVSRLRPKKTLSIILGEDEPSSPSIRPNEFYKSFFVVGRPLIKPSILTERVTIRVNEEGYRVGRKSEDSKRILLTP